MTPVVNAYNVTKVIQKKRLSYELMPVSITLLVIDTDGLAMQINLIGPEDGDQFPEIEEVTDRIAELEAENGRLRAVLQDIVDDPVISEPLGMKRGVSHILAIAREGLAD